MKQDLVKKAYNILQQKKRNLENAYAEQMAVLYKNSEYTNLEKLYTQTKIENARREVLGEKPDKNFENKLKLEIENFKRENHISPIKYNCSICKDEGFINGEMCNCLKQEISKLLLKESGFEILEDFDSSLKTSGNLAPLYEKMKMWCHSDFKKNLVYLAGQTGVGKTHLVKCMANELILQGKIVKLVTAFNMNLDFKNFSKIKEEDLLKKYLDCNILIVDDLGTEPIFKNVSEEYLFLIINERKMRKLPTIITSNLTLEEIQNRYNDRIYSRIVDRQSSITVFLNGDDLRIKKY